MKTTALWVFRAVVTVLVVVVCLYFWFGLSVKVYKGDLVSHSFRVEYPLLGWFGRVVYRTPDYDPDKARWAWLKDRIEVNDGDVFFIRKGAHIYAIQVSQQICDPLGAKFDYLEVGTNSQIVHLTTYSHGRYFSLPTINLYRDEYVNQFAVDGKGYIYITPDFFLKNSPAIEIGLPVLRGNLESYRQAVPQQIHFEIQLWN